MYIIVESYLEIAWSNWFWVSICSRFWHACYVAGFCCPSDGYIGYRSQKRE